MRGASSVRLRLVGLRLVGLVGLVGIVTSLLACSDSGGGSDGSADPAPSASAAAGAPQKGVPKNAETDPDTPSTASGAVDAPVDCTGDPGTFYALRIEKLSSLKDYPLCAYKDTVVLIVNGASGCGYTPQYAPLEDLYTKYHDTQGKKFEVLAFPSKSFNQEKDTDAEVSDFCTTEYHITFPLTTIGPVIDDKAKNVTAQPVYQWLYAQPGMSTPVAWNFEKFLIGKDGKVVKRWLSAVSPTEGGEIDQAIAAALAK